MIFRWLKRIIAWSLVGIILQVFPQGSKVIGKGENSFFSPTGKYYYAFSTDSSGTNLKPVVL